MDTILFTYALWCRYFECTTVLGGLSGEFTHHLVSISFSAQPSPSSHHGKHQHSPLPSSPAGWHSKHQCSPQSPAQPSPNSDPQHPSALAAQRSPTTKHHHLPAAGQCSPVHRRTQQSLNMDIVVPFYLPTYLPLIKIQLTPPLTLLLISFRLILLRSCWTMPSSFMADWLLPTRLFSSDSHSTLFHSFQDSNSTPHSDPLELVFSKLNQLGNQIMDLLAAKVTQKGPNSKCNCYSKKSHVTCVPPFPKNHCQITRTNGSS